MNIPSLLRRYRPILTWGAECSRGSHSHGGFSS